MNKSLVALLGGTALLTLNAAGAAASTNPQGSLGAKSYAQLFRGTAGDSPSCPPFTRWGEYPPRPDGPGAN